MSMDLIYLFVGLGLGFALGYNTKKAPVIKKQVLPVTKDVEKLNEELLVYKNLRESLLEDVRYWRNKAKQNDIQN